MCLSCNWVASPECAPASAQLAVTSPPSHGSLTHQPIPVFTYFVLNTAFWILLLSLTLLPALVTSPPSHTYLTRQPGSMPTHFKATLPSLLCFLSIAWVDIVTSDRSTPPAPHVVLLNCHPQYLTLPSWLGTWLPLTYLSQSEGSLSLLSLWGAPSQLTFAWQCISRLLLTLFSFTLIKPPDQILGWITFDAPTTSPAELKEQGVGDTGLLSPANSVETASGILAARQQRWQQQLLAARAAAADCACCCLGESLPDPAAACTS